MPRNLNVFVYSMNLSLNSHVPLKKYMLLSIWFLYVEVIWGSFRQSSKNNALCVLSEVYFLYLILSSLGIYYFTLLAGILKTLTLNISPKGIQIVRFSSWTDWVTSSNAQKNKNKGKIIIQTKELQWMDRFWLTCCAINEWFGPNTRPVVCFWRYFGKYI